MDLDHQAGTGDGPVQAAFQRWVEAIERGEPGDPAQLGDGLSIAQKDELDGLIEVFRELGPALGPDPTMHEPALGKADRYVNLRDPKPGGMGVLYRAWDVELGRDVAYKVMKGEADSEVARRFAHEAEITARLQYPGIVPVFGRVVDDSGRSAYAMEYVEGSDLLDVIRRRQADSHSSGKPAWDRDVLLAVETACRIVGFAHLREVLHNDLSPKNLMIDSNSASYVVDWGLAHRVGTPVIGRTTAGTPGYVAPSVGRGGPRTYATDVYSLGAILAAVVLGVRPDGRPDLEPVTPNVPRPLRAIITAAMTDLADPPRPTYASASELAEELKHYLADEPIRAYREPMFERAWRGIRHRPARATAAVGLVMVSLLGVASAALIAEARSEASALADKARASAAETAAGRAREETLAEKARRAREEALASRVSEAILGYDFVLGQVDEREMTQGDDWIVAALKAVQATVRDKQQVAAAERLLAALNSLNDGARAAQPEANALRLKSAEARIRQGIEALDVMAREYPDLLDVPLNLAACYCSLSFIEVGGLDVTAKSGAAASLLASEILANLTGVRPEKAKLERALARLDQAEAILRNARVDPVRPRLREQVFHRLRELRPLVLNRLGRYSEALIAMDRSAADADPIHTPRVAALRMIYRMAAEKEQSNMPWSTGPHADHAHAIAMAGYLAGAADVSDPALFNAACTFSLASLDVTADSAERERRAKEAVALLARIAGHGYFGGARQLRELRTDYALDPIRSRDDFKKLDTMPDTPR